MAYIRSAVIKSPTFQEQWTVTRISTEVTALGTLWLSLDTGGTIRLDIEVHEPLAADSTVRSLSRIAKLVQEQGVLAAVVQTGGNVVTIYAGKPYPEGEYVRSPVLCGPGTFNIVDSQIDHLADVRELFIGPDDDGESEATDCAKLDDTSEIGIANEIVRQVRAFEEKKKP